MGCGLMDRLSKKLRSFIVGKGTHTATCLMAHGFPQCIGVID